MDRRIANKNGINASKRTGVMMDRKGQIREYRAFKHKKHQIPKF